MKKNQSIIGKTTKKPINPLRVLFIVIPLVLSACATSPPKKINNLCDIFDQKGGWYNSANKSSKRWGVSIGTMMAIMKQESAFVAKAKPPRKKVLWVFPGPRLSSAYGYPQAKKETWRDYEKAVGRPFADRDDFSDAIDFIGWYNAQSVKTLGLSTTDTYSLYLAYHEGHGGFRQRSYASKSWLTKVASEVSTTANNYNQQLKSCEDRLQPSWWWPF